MILKPETEKITLFYKLVFIAEKSMLESLASIGINEKKIDHRMGCIDVKQLYSLIIYLIGGTCFMTYRRVFTRAIKGYQGGINIIFGPKYLFYTNVFLSMSISTLGDLLEQTYEVHSSDIKSYNFQRTGHMGISGATSGILCHHWYKILDKVIIGRSFDMVMKKLCLDQFIASPIIIMTFFATVAVFEENPWENFTDEVKEKFWRLYKAEWMVWPPAQIINFYFLPTRFRVIYDNTISLGYDIYTSKVKHEKKTVDDKSTDNKKVNDDDDD